ncbi:cupin domain-containing protein [Mycolicibacterium fortuitum]|uniref:cupin domain-containing protein n=1 Tax=Mycolicibacterium fortuitum TaxID=1766 RepID=UPI0022BA2DCE|nr:cupin domain-containing protein [Mycolicibacterium fortuitum]WAY20853.1 cupin domain-containing protein [Mycolicibacterium fortuitum]
MRQEAYSVDAVALQLDHTALPHQSVMHGSPTTGHRELASLSDMSIGVWEHTPGVSRDVESDEVFVVLTGDATVAFDDGSPAIDLRPGSLARLYTGQRTTWTVRQTLRKVYIA